MKKLFTLTLLLLAGSFAFAQEDALGIWWTQAKESMIEIKKEGDKYVGRVIWIRDSLDAKGKPITDINNKDPKQRQSPIIGLATLDGFTYNASEKVFEGGGMYDPRSGKVYKGKFWLNDEGKLEVRGYVGFLFGTETWTRGEEK